MFRTKAKPKLVISGWETWEDQLILALCKEGKNEKQISQHLPDPTERACSHRRHYLLKAQSQDVSHKDALASPAPRKKYWSKTWEPWEDQIVITNHNAGKSWAEISKMLPPRSASSLRSRWRLFLAPPPQENVIPETQSRDTPSVPRPTKVFTCWTRGEDQLITSLRESGKTWVEIARQLPNRTERGCSARWHDYLYKRQEPPKICRQWEEWEERLLVSGCHAGLSWREVAKSITGRTQGACVTHWHNFFHSSDEDEPWTSEELAQLECLRWEGNNWDEISQKLPGHSPNACRLQWYKKTEGIQGSSSHQGHYDDWSAAEVETLIALYNTVGPRWGEICKHLPGRTESACNNHLYKKCTKADGLGGPPSELWKEFLKSKLNP